MQLARAPLCSACGYALHAHVRAHKGAHETEAVCIGINTERERERERETRAFTDLKIARLCSAL